MEDVLLYIFHLVFREYTIGFVIGFLVGYMLGSAQEAK
mgnify:CR=1 FL=1